MTFPIIGVEKVFLIFCSVQKAENNCFIYYCKSDEEKEVDAIALGAEGNLYLMVFNPSKDTKGKYTCEAYNL